MEIELNRWESTYLWNLANDDLGQGIVDGRPSEVTETIVNLMNKLDPEYEEDE